MTDPGQDQDLDGNTAPAFPGIPSRSSMPDWYPDLLESVASRVTTARAKAITAANQELVATYWTIGKDLINRESSEGWGANVVALPSADIHERFPEIRGYSPRNLRYMKSFAEAWPESSMLQRPVFGTR